MIYELIPDQKDSAPHVRIKALQRPDGSIIVTVIKDNGQEGATLFNLKTDGKMYLTNGDSLLQILSHEN